MEFKDDPKFSFIVPVYNVPEDAFLRCLKSITDQDYKNLEVIIVPNGGDEKAEAIAREFAKDRENWKIVPTAEKGACLARNLGFQNSTGEIVSFFNSDYIAKTGMVSMWVDALLKNTDCGFAYGAYEYRTQNKDVYWSKPFDVFELENANYIDCGFPVWRKHVVEWDQNVKSLQDWDFWLRVVKSGVKGHYLGREISFIAEVPRVKGLSHDSHDNWTDRVRFVKEKNGIPTRDICVTSLGAQYHGKEIAKMIGADYRDDTIHKPHNYKALYLIGWYMKPNQSHNEHPFILRRFDNAKRIVHFVGADIYWLRTFPLYSLKTLAGALKLSTTSILCENEAAQKELAEMGIPAEIVPIPPYTDLSIAPLPKEFSVALYLTNKSDFDKYLQKQTLSIVKAMPDVKFYGYGDGAKDFKAKNFEHVGNLSKEAWAQFVLDRSAYLRLVRHDTRPMASDEFVMAGRSVITNIPNEYMDFVDTGGDLEKNEWDPFESGFNAWNWPKTKKALIKKIRDVRRAQQKGGNEFEGERFARSIAFRAILSKDAYRRKIQELAGLAPVLEVVQ